MPCWGKRGCVNDIPLVKVFAFLALNYQHELPITGLSEAGVGWKHWLSKLVFKCILAGLHALHYSLPIQKNVALQAGVLQQADMRPVYWEVQKCRAENCGPRTALSRRTLHPHYSSVYVGWLKIFFLNVHLQYRLSILQWQH